ncbi:MAG: hypothetical protein V3S16_09865, partial [Candidatus Desulfatibia sp.]|uniref:glycosyltransferase family 9 protein n=1 Tax=Candidatus Desulfatibia sp. TaxID=3101189 RepID=UPI002F2E88A7
RIPGFPQPFNNPPSKLPANSKLIILRSGGIGDHIMMTPAIRSLKRTIPIGSEIWLATEKANHCLFEGNPDITRLFSLPVRMSHFMGADYYLEFSNEFISLYSSVRLTIE